MITQEVAVMTLNDWINQWLDNKARGVAETTHSKYASNLAHVQEHLGEETIEEIGTGDIDVLYDNLVDELSASTINTIHRTLSTCMADAHNRGHIDSVPTEGATPPRNSTNELTTLTEDEVGKLTDEISPRYHYDTAIYLALKTGMRQSEIIGLKWNHVGFANNVIKVQRRLTMVNGHHDYGQPKSESSIRSIAIDDETVDWLKSWYNYQLKHTGDEDFIITTLSGNWVYPSNLRSYLKKKTHKVGITDVTFHELRHTHATLCLENGVNAKVIQERLGHSSIDVTLNRYSHVTKTMQREAVEKMEDVI